MRQFKELGIKSSVKSFTGDKIKIERVLNRQITVLDFKIEKSKFTDKGNGRCLQMQIEVGSEKHVVFTGSLGLMDIIEKVSSDAFPFMTTIVKQNEHFEFS